MKDAHNGKQHKTYPILDSIIGNVFQSVVDFAGIINCFHPVVYKSPQVYPVVLNSESLKFPVVF